jgi:Fe-S-cluster containining protein
MEIGPYSLASAHAAAGRNVPETSPRPALHAVDRVFRCRRCGHCCQGEGGIVVGPADILRFRAHFDVGEAEFLAAYAETRRGKPALKTGQDGFCVFFREDAGCSVHPARPAVCRAWPFFRGNLVDASSFFLAREDCPGISRETGHRDFALAGFAYLREMNLLAGDPLREGRALIMTERDLPFSGGVPA